MSTNRHADAHPGIADALRDFWQLCAFDDPNAVIARREMLDALHAWTEARGVAAPGAKAFAALVRDQIAKAHGAEHRTDTTHRVAWSATPVDAWRGVRLLVAPTPPAAAGIRLDDPELAAALRAWSDRLNAENPDAPPWDARYLLRAIVRRALRERGDAGSLP